MQRRFKYIAQLTLLVGLFSIPALVQSDANNCSETGYTVIFINGVWDDYRSAQVNASSLGKKLNRNFNGQPLTVQLEYNASHLAGIGDGLEVAFPVLNQYDLQTILQHMHQDVHTQKVIIVGHSQGAVYANKVYEYLVAHGMSPESVAVYAVATPESYVAGGGKYITYALDNTVTNLATTFGLHPLAPNATFSELLDTSASNSAVPAQGHSFIDLYLGAFSDRIVSDIHQELAGLTAENQNRAECFTVPSVSLMYRAQGAALGMADPLVSGISTVSVKGYSALAAVAGSIGALAEAGRGAVAYVVTTPRRVVDAAYNNLTSAESNVKDFTVQKQIYGSSLDTSDVRDLLGVPQGGAAILALQKTINKPADPESAPAAEVATSTQGGVIDNEATSTVRVMGSREWPWPGGDSRVPQPATASVPDAIPPVPDPATTTPTTTPDILPIVPDAPTVLFTSTTTPPTLTVEECATSLN
ncbi:MAG: Phospholipase D/competence protein ComEA helix-hairpin-helix domain protein, partial [Candidatus Adlerbacteria bacterium]|nr:Phospholipase D/competence protein ComEA helix-hairpin-helix domain protein [Candidatus Adlerbacteria bacterium]